MTSTKDAVAGMVFHLIENYLRSATGDPGVVDSPEGRYLRVKDLRPEEITSLLDIWEKESTILGLSGVRVVISRSDAPEGISETYLSEPGKAITFYRNNNKGGLVYIQTHAGSEEAGLESMFTIRDRLLQEGLREGVELPKVLTRLGWKQAHGIMAEPPVEIAMACVEVLKGLSARRNVSLREFVPFVLESCALVAAEGGAVEESRIHKLIGAALPNLRIFPDDALWAPGLSEAAKNRRLWVNSCYSELSNASGVSQDQDDMAEKARSFQFRKPDDSVFAVEELAAWQALVAEYCLTRSPEKRREIPFNIFEQLFSTDTTGKKLGERVKAEIQEKSAGRIPEFDALEVEKGLNDGSEKDAINFLEAIPEEGDLPLKDSLSKKTLKMVLRVAYPRPESFQNPLIRLFEAVQERLEESEPAPDESWRVRLALDQKTSKDSLCRGLFPFLFGSTLNSISEASKDGTQALTLEVDPDLVQVVQLPGTIDPDADPDCVSTFNWESLRVEIHFERKSPDGEWEPDPQFNRLSWEPAGLRHLALTWFSTPPEEFPRTTIALALADERDLELWIDGVTSRRHRMKDLLLGTVLEKPEPLVAKILEARDHFLDEARVSGLSVNLLDGFCSGWEESIHQATKEFIPRGSVDPSLESVIGMDVIRLKGGEEAYMLPIHPIRLKWVSELLRYMEEALTLLLGEGKGLESVNARYHAAWLRRLTPHQHPPLLSTTSGKLLIPVAEEGWSEKFVLLKKEGGTSQEWTSTTDLASVQAIADQVVEYIHAHPHKLDGISILVILPTGGNFPAALVSRIRGQRELVLMPIEIVAIAPHSEWDGMVVEFEKVQEDESRAFGSGRFAPPLNLKLLDYLPATAPELIRRQQVDLAVLPHFFGNRVQVNEHTEAPDMGEGSFHSLHDPTSYIDRDSSSGTVSIVLRPRWNSACLDDWSTLNVRHFRSEPISPGAPENVDFVKLRIRFEEASELFMALHEAAHWVITLDQYIGRDQLENLPQHPDVLLVKIGVGTSGLYSLVISSNCGREFVVDRIARKISNLGITTDTSSIHKLSENYYQESRALYPGLILRSTGLAKTTQEVLGLIVAKTIAEARFPASPSNGIVTWIPLDEHKSWFDNGGSRSRADLCRITADLVDGHARVSVLIVEGKFQKAHDPSGTLQAATSLQLLRSILHTNGVGDGLSDETRRLKRLWWNELVSAMENVSPEASHLYEDGKRLGPRTNARIPKKIADCLRKGDFILDSARAVYSSALYEPGTQSKETEERGVDVVISGREKVKELLKVQLEDESGSEGGGLLPKPDLPLPPQKDLVGPSAPPEENPEKTNQGKGLGIGDSIAVKTSLPKDPTIQRGLPESELETRYQRIISAFQEVNVEVTIPESGPRYIEGPAFIQFRVGTGPGVDPKRLKERGDHVKIRLSLPEAAQIRFGIGAGAVNIEVPKDFKDRYFVDAGDMWSRWQGPKEGHLVVPLGEDQSGNIVSLDFSSSLSPHLLVGGTTGSGKSEVLNTLISGLARNYDETKLRFCLVDPKGTEFINFDKLPHLNGTIGFDDEDAEKILETACEEMQSRYNLMKLARVRSLPEYNAIKPDAERLPWWVIVLDEYADLTSDPDRKKSIEAILKRLTQKARAAGIHVIVATQKPSAEVINTTLRSNLPVQIALKTRSAIESRVIMDEQGAESLNGMGDALLHLPEGTVRIQCAKVN